MKLLILHGPNMNLFGIRSSKKGERITLDKINRFIRHYVRNTNLDVKIMQTHNESKAVSYIQKNRKKIDAIIITPGPWIYSGYILLDLLYILNIPYTVISLDAGIPNSIFNNNKIIYHSDILKSFQEAIEKYANK
ncbi:MAG: hypothetical protein CMG66_05390 [Candidatus Marinimicrobia bacterium]|nr:hypothetical protein [Candidatus Neomarinimicrobiota bacterium]|tara:strand:+ start:18525 stop:18929 length:405 start_codon:yes stop_codon:yes gene_type:complete